MCTREYHSSLFRHPITTVLPFTITGFDNLSPFKGDDDDEVSLAGDQSGVERVQQLREEHRVQLARVRERPLKY